jgi:Spy/CpxP family protein refolding chaperone
MKKAMLAILAASVFATPATFAQGRGTPPDPATMVAHHVQHLATLLDLTSAQVTAATATFTTAASAAAPLEASLRAAHKTLEADIHGGTGDILNDANAITSIENQLLVIRSNAEKTFYASLTTTQQDKLKALGPGGFGGRGPHGPGGFGGPGR